MTIDWKKFESQDELQDRDEEWWDKFESDTPLTEEPSAEEPSPEPSRLRTQMGQFFDFQAKFPQIKPEDAEVVREELPREPGIYPAPPETIIDKVSGVIRSITKASKDKASVTLALAEHHKISPSQAEEEYEALTADVPGQPSSIELYTGLLALPIVAGLMSNPLGTIAALTGFMALGEAESFIISKAKNKPYMFGEQRGLVDLAPKDINERTKFVLDTIDFIGKAAVLGGGFAKLRKTEPYRKMTNRERGLVALNIAEMQRAGYKETEILNVLKKRSKAEYRAYAERRGYTTIAKMEAEEAARKKAAKPPRPPIKVAEELKAAIEKEREVSPLGVLREKISKIEEAAKVEKEVIRKKFEEKKVKLRREEPEVFYKVKGRIIPVEGKPERPVEIPIEREEEVRIPIVRKGRKVKIPIERLEPEEILRAKLEEKPKTFKPEVIGHKTTTADGLTGIVEAWDKGSLVIRVTTGKLKGQTITRKYANVKVYPKLHEIKPPVKEKPPETKKPAAPWLEDIAYGAAKEKMSLQDYLVEKKGMDLKIAERTLDQLRKSPKKEVQAIFRAEADGWSMGLAKLYDFTEMKKTFLGFKKTKNNLMGYFGPTNWIIIPFNESALGNIADFLLKDPNTSKEAIEQFLKETGDTLSRENKKSLIKKISAKPPVEKVVSLEKVKDKKTVSKIVEAFAEGRSPEEVQAILDKSFNLLRKHQIKGDQDEKLITDVLETLMVGIERRSHNKLVLEIEEGEQYLAVVRKIKDTKDYESDSSKMEKIEEDEDTGEVAYELYNMWADFGLSLSEGYDVYTTKNGVLLLNEEEPTDPHFWINIKKISAPKKPPPPKGKEKDFLEGVSPEELEEGVLIKTPEKILRAKLEKKKAKKVKGEVTDIADKIIEKRLTSAVSKWFAREDKLLLGFNEMDDVLAMTEEISKLPEEVQELQDSIIDGDFEFDDIFDFVKELGKRHPKVKEAFTEAVDYAYREYIVQYTKTPSLLKKKITPKIASDLIVELEKHLEEGLKDLDEDFGDSEITAKQGPEYLEGMKEDLRNEVLTLQDYLDRKYRQGPKLAPPPKPKKPTPPGKKKVAEHRVLPGTQKGLYDNFILRDKEGNIYEGDVGEHIQLIRDFGLKLEDISRVGIVKESGEYSLKKVSPMHLREWEDIIRVRDRGEPEAELDELSIRRKKKQQQKDDTIDLFSGIPFHKFDKEIIDPLKNLYLRHVGDPLWNFLTETLPVKAGKKSKFIDYINKQTWVMGLLPEYRKDPKFIDLRDETQMRIQQYRARARELAEMMAKFPRAEQIRIAQIIRGGVTATPKRYGAAFEAIQRFQELEKDLHKLGILGPDNRFRQLNRKEIADRFREIAALDKQIEKFQKRKGKAKEINKLMDKRTEILERIRLHYRMSGKLYLRRTYEKIEAEKKFVGRLLSHLRKRGPKLVKGYEKRRKDLSKEYRQYLGEIEQAPFLAYKGLSEESHDVELMKMFVEISQNKDWAISPEEWANIQAVKRRHRLIEKYENFKPLPVTIKLGPLSGALVDPYIWDDLNQAVEIKGDLLKAYEGLLSLWKTGKVVYNPATQARNILSNSILADFGDLPQWRIDIYAKAAKDFATKSGYWLEATKNTPLLGKEWAAVEAIDFLKATASLKRGGFIAEGAKLIAKYLDKPTALYQFWEQFFKLAVYTSERQKGVGIKAAYKKAEEHIFNYRALPPVVRWAKRWYSPFITFSYKALPLVAKTAVRKPWKLAKYLILFAAVEEITRRMRGESKEEVEREKKVLPDHMRKSIFPGQLSHLRIPYTDKWGRSKYLDLSFILPWGDVAEQWGQSHLVGRPFLPSHPLWVVVGEIAFNEILFTGQDLTVKDLDEGADYWKKIGTQLWRQAMPSLAGSYSYNKIMSAMKSEKDWVGRERSIEEAIFDTFFGLKIRSVDYYEALDRRINELDRYKGELKKRFRRDYRKLIMNPTPDREYDERRQRKLLEKLNEDVERIIDKTLELQK